MTEAAIKRITDGAAILSRLEREPAWRIPEWPQLGFPVIDRRRHAIFPLAIAPMPEGADPTAAARLEDDADHLRLHCMHYYSGDRPGAPLDLDSGYGRRILDAGPVLPSPGILAWWSVQNLGVVLVRSVAESRRLETLALHVVPREWLRWSVVPPSTKRDASRARSMLREQSGADASWSWPLDRPGPALLPASEG